MCEVTRLTHMVPARWFHCAAHGMLGAMPECALLALALVHAMFLVWLFLLSQLTLPSCTAYGMLGDVSECLLACLL